jgi:hypothetical protein
VLWPPWSKAEVVQPVAVQCILSKGGCESTFHEFIEVKDDAMTPHRKGSHSRVRAGYACGRNHHAFYSRCNSSLFGTRRIITG